jgi:hypothetical protein
MLFTTGRFFVLGISRSEVTLIEEFQMAKAAIHGKSLHSAWVVKKKVSGEWIVVAIASLLGFGVIFTLITFLELSAVK